MQEPVITVGILSGKEIGFSFPKEFISSDGIAICGIQQAVYRKGKICWQEKEYDELSFTPQQDTSSFFELQDVTIGINFHWERKEVQRFKLSPLNLLNGTTMKPTKTLMYVPMTIASVIKALHAPQLHRQLKLFLLHGVKYLCMKERFVTLVSLNVAAALSKNSRTAGRM